MEFTVTTQLTASGYAKTIVMGLYRKPAFILAAGAGLYFLIHFYISLHASNSTADTDVFELVGGALLFLLPVLVTAIALRHFRSNPAFANPVSYTFNNDGMAISGDGFKGFFNWEQIRKYKETGNFLILFHSSRTGNFIDKREMNLVQLAFIKSRVIRQQARESKEFPRRENIPP